MHIFTCRAHDKVTCTKSWSSWKGVFTSRLRFSFICFCKRCFDESFRFILSRSISVSFLKHSENTHRSVKNNVLRHFGINTLFVPRFHGPVVVVTTYNDRALKSHAFRCNLTLSRRHEHFSRTGTFLEGNSTFSAFRSAHEFRIRSFTGT